MRNSAPSHSAAVIQRPVDAALPPGGPTSNPGPRTTPRTSPAISASRRPQSLAIRTCSPRGVCEL